MALATQLAQFVYAVDLDRLDPFVAQARTLIIDALACTIAGTDTQAARMALAGAAPARTGRDVVRYGLHTSASAAALVNGAMLRALDLTDTYVGRDVCHPGEIIPTALACAEAAGASGRALLEAVVAGLALHMQLANGIPLHRHGLHHTGQAAWVVPLVAARLHGRGPAVAAQALTIGAHGLIVPESFGRGQLTNLKAFAYPLLARAGIDAAHLAAAGLLDRRTHARTSLISSLNGSGWTLRLTTSCPRTARRSLGHHAEDLSGAIRPAAADRGCRRRPCGDSALARRLDRVIVRASRRTIERTADPAKYAPEGPEAADHSLPFCVAAALVDGELTPDALRARTLAQSEVLELMARIETEAVGEDESYQIGPAGDRARLSRWDDESAALQYPAQGESWLAIAERKLRAAGRHGLDPDRSLRGWRRSTRSPACGGLWALWCQLLRLSRLRLRAKPLQTGATFRYSDWS